MKLKITTLVIVEEGQIRIPEILRLLVQPTN